MERGRCNNRARISGAPPLFPEPRCTWKVGGIITGVGEPDVIPDSRDGCCAGEGDAPSTWKPTTCIAGRWYWSLPVIPRPPARAAAAGSLWAARALRGPGRRGEGHYATMLPLSCVSYTAASCGNTLWGVGMEGGSRGLCWVTGSGGWRRCQAPTQPDDQRPDQSTSSASTNHNAYSSGGQRVARFQVPKDSGLRSRRCPAAAATGNLPGATSNNQWSTRAERLPVRQRLAAASDDRTSTAALSFSAHLK